MYTYENWSREQADRYYNLIMDEIEFIADNFECGKSMENLKKGYRSTKVKSHVIFYIKSSKNRVQIIRILHQNMDVERRIND